MIHEPVSELVQLHRRMGDARLYRWLGRYSVGQASEALAELVEKSRAHLGIRGNRVAEALANDLQNDQVVLLTLLDVEYPASLRSLCNDAPPFLYVKGNLERLSSRSIAVIGTRRPTAAGRAAARIMAAGLVKAGYLVVSGNAPGVDSFSHEAAASSGGETVVFPAAPLDSYVQNFKAQNPEQVTVATPFAPGTAVEPWLFLRRNTLVSAHCHAGFVAETGTRGGTLDTVKKLGQMRREIFATLLPEEAKFARAHSMLQAGGVKLVDVLNNERSAVRHVIDAATRCLRHSTVGMPVLDDLFPEELL